MPRSILFACLLIAIPTTLLAQTAEDWKLCRGTNQDTGVPACTRLINNSGLSRKQRADAQSELAAFFQTKDAARAITEYSKAIALDPTLAKAYAGRARSYLEQRNYDRAVADCTKAIELDPSIAAVYTRRGYALFKSNELDRSIIDYTKAIEIDPKYMWAYIERADVFKAKGDQDHAASDYLKASELVPQGGSDDEAPFLNIVDGLIAIGHIDDTVRPISRIADSNTNLKLRVLRRYEKLWSNTSVVAALAPDLQQQREIARIQTESDKAPRSLNLKTWTLSALSDNKRYAEAERVGYEVLATLSAYDDVSEREPWFRGEIARALLRQGKVDKAQVVMKPVMARLKTLKDLGAPLNYGVALVHAGHYREAIDVVKTFDVDNDSGWWRTHSPMVITGIRACSEHALGNHQRAEANVTRMVRQSSPSDLDNVFDALVCTGQDDKAAQFLVKLLKSEPTKLIEYQGCSNADPEREHGGDYLRIFERPEVRVVVEPIGRIRQNC